MNKNFFVRILKFAVQNHQIDCFTVVLLDQVGFLFELWRLEVIILRVMKPNAKSLWGITYVLKILKFLPENRIVIAVYPHFTKLHG